MTQATVSSKSYNTDIANCINNYMEQKINYNCNSNERTIYDELEEKDRDLMLAAEIGQALMDANENLKQKKESLVEEFQQKLYEMENEKVALKKKLDAVEYDYEMQLHALQRDIVALRKDLSCQKNNYQAQLEERDIDVNDLIKTNEALIRSLSVTRNENHGMVQQLTELEDRMNNERLSMHGHLDQLESLKSEIICLREEKKQLETRIHDLMQERDCLVSQLHEAQQRNEDLERIDKQNRETIAIQEQEVINLQHTASFLQDSITHFQKKTDTSGDVNLADDLCIDNHRGAVRPASVWWKVWVEGDRETVEMDEDSVMTTMAMSGETSFDTMMCLQQETDDISQPSFVRELKVEVVEVYAQMRTICADLSFRYCTDPSKPGSTPDELALVEMDFKLGSLRDTLRELRGLMSDLVAPTVPAANGQMGHTNMEEMRQALDQKTLYLSDLQRELEVYDSKLGELVIRSDQFEDTELVQDLMDRKRDVVQKMTRTQSEMEVLTSSMIVPSSHDYWMESCTLGDGGAGQLADGCECEYD